MHVCEMYDKREELDGEEAFNHRSGIMYFLCTNGSSSAVDLSIDCFTTTDSR